MIYDEILAQSNIDKNYAIIFYFNYIKLVIIIIILSL